MLLDQLRVERISAFKQKQNIKRNILTFVINESCVDTTIPTDEEIREVIKRFIKEAKDVQEVSPEGSYDFFQATQELDVLEKYVKMVQA